VGLPPVVNTLKNSFTLKAMTMKYFNYSIAVTAWLKCQLLIMSLLVAYAAQAQGVWNTPAQSNTVKRTLQWQYGGYIFTNDFTFSYSSYNYYKGLSKTQPKENYATEHSNHPYLLQIAKVLDEDAKALGYTGFKLAEYLTAFVQQAIPYKSDPYNNGWDYPKYPIETLVEQGGDCEDKAALLVALLKAFGFDAVMISLPGHIAAAVSCGNCNGYYNHNGKKYAFIETTEKGWGIGVVPPSYQYTGANILETANVPQFKREDVLALNGNNRNPDLPYNWTSTPKVNYNGNVNTVSTVGTSNSTSTVTINGTTYRIQGSGSTTITVSGTTVTIITQ
jgi:hypothetical protein